MRTSEDTARPEDDLPAPRLNLFGPGRVGFLKLFITATLWINVRLHPRLAKVILVLHEQLTRDAGLPPDFQGWMTDSQIARALGSADRRAYTPQAATITKYRNLIARMIKEMTPSGHRPPKLFETERLVGTRLARQVEVIDLSTRLD